MTLDEAARVWVSEMPQTHASYTAHCTIGLHPFDDPDAMLTPQALKS
ncbi:MAG: hypothetical protein QW057_01395 [Candidatus Bathyarchaeia archaeon]